MKRALSSDARVEGADAERHQRLVAVTGAIADAISQEEVYEAVVDQVSAALGASSGALFMLEGSRLTRLVRAVGYPALARTALDGLATDGPVRLPVLDSIARGEPLWIESQAELLDEYPHLAGHVTPNRSYRIACLPIRTQGPPLGALAFTFDDAPPMTDDHRAFLQLVARYCGQALERMLLFEAEKRSRGRAEASAARMALLSSASRAFAEAGADRDAVLQSLVEVVTAEHADSAAVFLAVNRQLELAASHHRSPEAAVAMSAMLTATPIRFGDGMSGTVTESVAIVPMKRHGRVIGTFNVMRQDGWPPLSSEDQQLFEELADRAAIAVESSRLYDESASARARAELLYRLAREVIEATQVGEVYQAALDAIGRAVGTDRCAILVLDGEGTMRFAAHRQLSDEYRLAVEGHSPWPRDVRDPAPVLVPEVERDQDLARFLPLFRGEGIASLGFFPLLAAGRLLGKFVVYHARPRWLAPQEIELALAIAHHVGAAVARFDALAELERTVHLNELFTGILGHDLRNPLHAIMTAANVSLLRGEDGHLLKPLTRILASAERMARMIDQLLDFTRVRAGAGIPIARRRLDMVPLVRQVADELEDANPDLTVQLDQVGDTVGRWDPDRLAQVFSNLLGNAVQHGDATGGVRIRVVGGDPEIVRVEVWNHGVIAASRLPRLFEPMGGGEERMANAPGLGLGLFITEQIARAHGGSVSVESSEQLGTRFTVHLPRSADASTR